MDPSRENPKECNNAFRCRPVQQTENIECFSAFWGKPKGRRPNGARGRAQVGDAEGTQREREEEAPFKRLVSL